MLPSEGAAAATCISSVRLKLFFKFFYNIASAQSYCEYLVRNWNFIACAEKAWVWDQETLMADTSEGKSTEEETGNVEEAQ